MAAGESRVECLPGRGTVKDETGKLLAKGSSKQIIIPGLQTVNQAVAAAGVSAIAPKFL